MHLQLQQAGLVSIVQTPMKLVSVVINYANHVVVSGSALGEWTLPAILLIFLSVHDRKVDSGYGSGEGTDERIEQQLMTLGGPLAVLIPKNSGGGV